MHRREPGAERFIAGLERLLEAAREAAAVALIQEVKEGERLPPTLAELKLHSCVTEFRRGRGRVIVQLQGNQSLYEGTAEMSERLPCRGKAAARATLAALAEWVSSDGLSDCQFTLREVIAATTVEGPVTIVAATARCGDAEPRRLVGCAWQTDEALAAARATLQACRDALPIRPPSSPVVY